MPLTSATAAVMETPAPAYSLWRTLATPPRLPLAGQSDAALAVGALHLSGAFAADI